METKHFGYKKLYINGKLIDAEEIKSRCGLPGNRGSNCSNCRGRGF